jgi:hypothetical protein
VRGDRHLGAMDAIPRCLEVHSRAASQLQPDLAAAGKPAVGKHFPQLREQCRESHVGRRRTAAWPKRFGELVTAGDPVAIDDQIGEQEPSLPAGELLLDSPACHSGNEASAQLDPSPFPL